MNCPAWFCLFYYLKIILSIFHLYQYAYIFFFYLDQFEFVVMYLSWGEFLWTIIHFYFLDNFELFVFHLNLDIFKKKCCLSISRYNSIILTLITKVASKHPKMVPESSVFIDRRRSTFSPDSKQKLSELEIFCAIFNWTFGSQK